MAAYHFSSRAIKRQMIKFAAPALTIMTAPAAFGAYANYNNVLLGDRAAGLSGAYTALSTDAAATPFYNPATTVLEQASSLAGSVHVYNKYETSIGQSDDYTIAPAKVSRGFFRSLPSSSGVILNFKSYALGLSILVPDYDFYNGQVTGDATTTSTLNSVDESLWTGGTFSKKLTDNDSVGFSLYYTARDFSRSVTDRLTTATNAVTITVEQKELTSNNLVGILGYHRRLGAGWSVGLSYRPPSIQVAGEGSYYRATTQTTPFNATEVNNTGLTAVTMIPQKVSIGIAREVPNRYSAAFDVQLYGALNYRDFPDFDQGTDDIHYRQVANFAFGYEQFVKPWLSVRAGASTNLSSAGSPIQGSPYRQMDQINLYGCSANVSFRPHEQTTFTFGGYYSGGSGLSSQYVGNSVRIVTKSQQIFTMLVGTGFHF